MWRVAPAATVGIFLGVTVAWAADTTAPDAVEVPTMRTSIYIGSVTLSLSLLERAADGIDYSADYQAKVFPWWFWSETGTITLTPSESELQRLLKGETIEVSGEAMNHKGQPREVSARIEPAESTRGAIKVRIDAGGTKLIFNGSYVFDRPH